MNDPKMDDERVASLLRLAVELEDFETAIDSNNVSAPPAIPRAWWIRFALAAVPLATAAILLILLLPTRDIDIADVRLAPTATRSSALSLGLNFRLNQPAYTTIVVIDARYERWIVPFDENANAWLRLIEGRQSLSIRLYPVPDDPRGPAEVIAALVLARSTRFESPQEILGAIPDPVLPPSSSRSALVPRLAEISGEVSRQLGCSVKFGSADDSRR